MATTTSNSLAAMRRSEANHSPSPGRSPGRRRDRTRERERDRGPRRPTQQSMLAKALEQANTAVLLDNAHNIEGALESYSDACTLLQQVMVRSGGDEDRRKLDEVRQAYNNRIIELKNTARLERQQAQQDHRATKALPARPEHRTSFCRGRASSQSSSVSNSDESVIIVETARVQRLGQDSATSPEQPAWVPLEMASRPGASMTSPPRGPIRSDASPRRLPSSNQRDTWTDAMMLGEQAAPNVDLRTPMDQAYMPPPLSPRRPSSPIAPAPKSNSGYPRGRTETAGQQQQQQQQQERLRPPPPPQRTSGRAEGNESTSWLDTIDESAPSSPSSIHSGSSSVRRRRRYRRAPQEETAAEFDAAMDAAVEAAYDDTFEPAEVAARLEDERMRESAREAEREELIARAREHAIRRSLDHRPERDEKTEDDSNDDPEARRRAEEERLLEDMTNGFSMDDFEFNQQSKSALPRRSNSSGFSGRTGASSIGSNPTTAATSMQTLAEEPSMPQLPAELRSRSPPPPPPSLPPPTIALPPPPVDPLQRVSRTSSLIDPMGPSVRNRRLSGQKPLVIEVGKTQAADEPLMAPSPSFSRPLIPQAPKTSLALPARPMDYHSTSDTEPTPTLMPPLPVRKPVAAASDVMTSGTSPAAGRPVTPGLSRLLTPEAGLGVQSISAGSSPSRALGGSLAGPGFRKKNASTSSLKNRNLSLSSPDESDISPSTPTLLRFSSPSSAPRKAHTPLIPAPPLPTSASIGLPLGVGPGHMGLFDREIHSLYPPDASDALMAYPPASLEPCPSDAVLRPYWLMRCLSQTIMHPRGGYLSTRMFVPRDIWQVQSVKLKAIEEKVSNCDFLTAALLKLAKVDTMDADAVLEEMQSLEHVLDQVQATLTKKLGNDVGAQGVAAWLRENGTGGEGSHGSEPTSTRNGLGSNRAYMSWSRRLRTKTSSATLSGNTAPPKEPVKDGLSISSLPMTNNIAPRPARRETTPMQFTGPNAVYTSALARLFDAVQVLDEIARRAEDPGLRHSSPTHVGLELSSRHASEFFAFYVCRFVLADISVLLDKFIKRGTKWVLS